jgi:AraC family transcriptional regulator of arabinose operon
LHRDAQRAGLSPTGDTELHLLEKSVAVELTMNGIEEVLLTVVASLRRNTQHLDARVQLVLDAITADPARPHTLTSLAGLAQVSVSRLAHLFKEQVGDSIMNVVVALRLQRAAELLGATDMSVAQIARAVGFDSPHYFAASSAAASACPRPPTAPRSETRS